MWDAHWKTTGVWLAVGRNGCSAGETRRTTLALGKCPLPLVFFLLWTSYLFSICKRIGKGKKNREHNRKKAQYPSC